MKLDIFYGADQVQRGMTVAVTLSRRNLLALLAKLDGSPEHSKMTIAREQDAGFLTVTAEEDEAHYAYRVPGAMHPDTEAALAAEQAHETEVDPVD